VKKGVDNDKEALQFELEELKGWMRKRWGMFGSLLQTSTKSWSPVSNYASVSMTHYLIL
jgi:hypothetical protein